MSRSARHHSYGRRVLAALLALPIGTAAQQQTLGNCSPIISGTGTNAKIEIKCLGGDSSETRTILDKVTKLSNSVEDAKAFVASIMMERGSANQNQLVEILSAAERQLYETKRIQYKLEYEDIPMTVALRYPLLEGALAPYGSRVSQYFKDGALWPIIYPFNTIKWLTPSDRLFPRNQDGSAMRFLDGTQITVSCFSPAQMSSAELRQKLSAVKSMASLRDVVDSAYFSQTISIKPNSCGISTVIGEAFNEKVIILRGEKIAPKNGETVRPGDFISALDLFGAICYITISNDDSDSVDGSDISIAEAHILETTMHFNGSSEYGVRINTNFQHLDTTAHAQLFRWTMPTSVTDLGKIASVGSFPKVPVCDR